MPLARRKNVHAKPLKPQEVPIKARVENISFSTSRFFLLYFLTRDGQDQREDLCRTGIFQCFCTFI